MTLAALIALLAAGAAAEGTPILPPPSGMGAPTPPPPPPAAAQTGARLIPIPFLTYRSDHGIGTGILVFIYGPSPSPGAPRDWVSPQVYWSERGPKYAKLSAEVLRLGGTSLRLLSSAQWTYETDAPYWGRGAALPLGGSPGSGAPPAAYGYRSQGTSVFSVLRGDLAGPLRWFGRVRYEYVDVLHSSALLRLEAPHGAEGGGLALGAAGLVFDSRDTELGTHRGVFADASIFAGPPVPRLAEFASGGANLTVRGYVPLSPRLTLAARGLAELRRGDVPFFAWMETEGIAGGEGLGGSDTIRGVARDRIAGPDKLLANVELRRALPRFSVYGRTVDLALAAGVDAGLAHQPGFRRVAAPGAVVGLRAVLDGASAIRLDLGWAGEGLAIYFVADPVF